MNFKIDHLTNFNNGHLVTPSVTFVPILTSLVVYGHQRPSQQQSLPTKKSFKFKTDKSAQPTSQKINIYCIQSNEWTSHQVKGKIPPARHAHKMIYLHPCLILFGGKSFANPTKLLNDCYALNVETWTWKKLFTLEGPPAFQNHYMAKLSDTKLVLVGKQIWTLSIKDVKWQLSANQLPGAVWQKINVLVDSLLIGVGVKNEDQILIFQEGGIVNSLDLKNKILNQENSMRLDKVLVKRQQAGVIHFYSFFNDEYFFVMYNETISSYSYHESSFDLELLDQQAIENFKAVSIDSHDSFLYIFTEKQEIYQIDCSQIKTERKANDSPNRNSPNCVSSKQLVNNSSCIIEESHQSSAYCSKQNQNEDRNSDFQGTERHSQQQKDSRVRVSDKGHSKFMNEPNQEEYESQEQREISTFQEEKIKAQLGTLLAYQHFKRKISETKSRLLEHAIKKSQKMVLTLCKFGNQKDKRKHIQKVKILRQQLQQVWGKQIYYRKEIQNRQTDICMEKLLEENLSNTYSQYLH